MSYPLVSFHSLALTPCDELFLISPYILFKSSAYPNGISSFSLFFYFLFLPQTAQKGLLDNHFAFFKYLPLLGDGLDHRWTLPQQRHKNLCPYCVHPSKHYLPRISTIPESYFGHSTRTASDDLRRYLNGLKVGFLPSSFINRVVRNFKIAKSMHLKLMLSPNNLGFFRIHISSILLFLQKLNITHNWLKEVGPSGDVRSVARSPPLKAPSEIWCLLFCPACLS